MHGDTVPDAPTTGSVTLPSLSAPEPEDVKPVIPRPFPMAAPDTPRMNNQNRQRTQISASPAASLSRSPLRRVKREPSLVVTRLVPSSMDPIYISSDEDEDEEEVHKQIEASTSQATSARSSEKEAAVLGDQDQEEPDGQEEEGEERRGEEAAEEEEQSTAAEPADEEEHDEDAAEEPKVKEEKIPQGTILEKDEEEEGEEEGGEAQSEEENMPQVAALDEPEEDEEEEQAPEEEAPKDQAEDPEEDELEEEGVDDDKMVEEDGVDDGKVDEDEDEDEKLPKEDDDKMAEDEDENEDEELPAEDDKEEDSEPEENSANPHPLKSQSPSKSPSRSPSSSPPPPDPFSLARSSAIPKPQPRPKVPSLSLSQPPPKRRLSSTNDFAIPATQPVASSRRSKSRPPAVESRGSTSTAIGNASAIEEDEEVEVEEIEVEEDDKRYAKRPKTQAQTPSTAPKHTLTTHAKKHLRKHPDYWLLDGSVTLQLENTLFRLHRSRLVTQSTYFQELFAAQPDMLGEGCAYKIGGGRGGEKEEWVYVIKGVSVGDFEELLRALDNAISYVYDPPPFFKLAAILRASLTLHFPSLSSFVIRTLRTTWSPSPSSLSSITTTRIPHAAETIILARTCEGSGLGLHDIMKRAFYELVRTARMGEDVDADEEDPDVMSGQVSRQDLARLIRAREELVSRWVTAAVSPPDIICAQEGHVPIDKAKLLECWQEKVVRGGVFEEGMYDPIVGLQRLGEVRWEEQVCKGCVEVWREVWEKMRVKLWGQLDLWLGLPEGGGEKEE